MSALYDESQNALERSSATSFVLINVEGSTVRNPNLVCTGWRGFIIRQILLRRSDQRKAQLNKVRRLFYESSSSFITRRLSDEYTWSTFLFTHF
jgi:hypothetical protein